MRLLLGHLIGDFPLQFDKLHKLKYQSNQGIVWHVLMVTACLTIFSWPYLAEPRMWAFLAFVGATHFLQDWAKIKFIKDSKHNLFFFLADQAMHVAVLSTVFLMDFKNPSQEAKSFWINAYNSHTMAVGLCAAIVASYACHYIIFYLKEEYLKVDNTGSAFEKYYGFIERIAVAFSFLAGTPWIWAIPAIMACRLPLSKVWNLDPAVRIRFSSLENIILSGCTALCAGALFSLL